MKTEKIVLSFIATILGLLVAGVAFFLFSAKETTPPKTKATSTVSPTPTALPSISLTLSQPKDEEVVNKKTITVSGKTRSDAVVVILTNGIESVIAPTISGDFSAQITISNGQNIIEVVAVAADGETKSIKKTVTYSEEEF
ncbi:MAG: hypothetical protein AAB583_04420 [Patescibacteria group bacterium]